jgi:hypothetical protein
MTMVVITENIGVQYVDVKEFSLYNIAMNEELDDITGEQAESSPKTEHLKPWQYKKGQSGNPSGRAKGISLKEYAKMKFLTMTDEEKEEFFNGLSKDTIWEMGEGRPESKSEVKVTEDVKVDDKQINAIRTALGLTNKTTDSAGS